MITKPAPAKKLPAPATTSKVEDSAKASLDKFLATYGLQGLGDWAWNKMLRGESYDQVLLEMRDQPVYKARFPAMEELAKSGHAMKESEYIAQENAYMDVFHAYGLPKGFYDQPADFAKFMVGHVSADELNTRVKAYTGAVMGDTETLHQLQTLYSTYGHDGNPTGDLLAHYLDPKAAAPVLEQQLSAAQFASAGKRSGFGQLSQAEAETYGARTGIDEHTAEQGFSELTRAKELMDALPGEGADSISRQAQLTALGEYGQDVLRHGELERRRGLRVAEGSGGGGFSTTQRGAKGLGSSEV